MKKIFSIFTLLIISSTAFAGEAAYLNVSFKKESGKNLRVVLSSSYPSCIKIDKAKKVYEHESNRLMEVAIFVEGEWISAKANENPTLQAKVNDIFSQSQSGIQPCEIVGRSGSGDSRQH